MPPERKNTSPAPPQRTEPVSPPSLDAGLYTPVTLPLAGQDPPKNRKKKFIIAAIIIFILAVVGAGVAWGYSLYQTPEKVVSDVLTKALDSKSVTAVADLKSLEKSADGSEEEFLARLEASAEGTKGTATLDVTANGVSYGGSFISAGNKESYIKVKNLEGIITAAFGEEVAGAQFKPFIDTVKEKWIRLDDSSTADASVKEYAGQQDCYNNALDAYYKSKVQRQQLVNAYKNNQLFKAKHAGEQTINGVESLRIELTPDRSKYAGFIAEVKRADVVVALDKCSKGELVKSLDEDAKNQSATTDETKLEIWASKWEHVLTQAKVATKGKDGSNTALQVVPTFNKPVAIETPTESISMQQVFESFMKAFLGASGGSATDAGTGLQLN